MYPATKLRHDLAWLCLLDLERFRRWRHSTSQICMRTKRENHVRNFLRKLVVQQVFAGDATLLELLGEAWREAAGALR